VLLGFTGCGKNEVRNARLKPAHDSERGLHFICLNAKISRQFEFLQNAWMANSKFSGLPERATHCQAIASRYRAARLLPVSQWPATVLYDAMFRACRNSSPCAAVLIFSWQVYASYAISPQLKVHRNIAAAIFPF